MGAGNHTFDGFDEVIERPETRAADHPFERDRRPLNRIRRILQVFLIDPRANSVELVDRFADRRLFGSIRSLAESVGEDVQGFSEFSSCFVLDSHSIDLPL